ncbi:hypothetical protein BpHYR1_019769 [Brachionus plicatilis]|uniref:Uncharacterized protein n=1 Tax=Brachionus plicatilis TaxID=10195 RepID=A0A3M7PQW1_BRAPC|nr:hypothetical protein BpHYR1_019769 [Brachionus plicatilis]
MFQQKLDWYKDIRKILSMKKTPIISKFKSSVMISAELNLMMCQKIFIGKFNSIVQSCSIIERGNTRRITIGQLYLVKESSTGYPIKSTYYIKLHQF